MKRLVIEFIFGLRVRDLEILLAFAFAEAQGNFIIFPVETNMANHLLFHNFGKSTFVGKRMMNRPMIYYYSKSWRKKYVQFLVKK